MRYAEYGIYGVSFFSQRPSLMSLQAVSPEPLRFSWPLWLRAPVCGEASPLLPRSLLQCPVAPLESLGCSGSPPLLLIVAYWIDLLSRVFRSKTKRGSHGWPISAFPFNFLTVVQRCWLTGLVSTVYKKVLCEKSSFSHRPVWHQCRDDLLLLESVTAQLCGGSVWVSLATSLSYAEPKIPHCAGGKSVCRHVLLINDFSGWFVCSACGCHYCEPVAGGCNVPLLLTSTGSIVYKKAALVWLSTELWL